MAISFLPFYPSKYISIDEHDYLANTQRILEGSLKQPCEPYQQGLFDTNKGYCVSKYNIGTSLILIPMTAISERLAFLTTFLVFLAGIFLFNKILIQYKIDPFFTYLFSFYPPLIYYSRTLFSEVYSATLILGVLYFLKKLYNENKLYAGLLAGILTGAAILVRYTNVIPLLVLNLFFLYESFYQKGSAKKMVLDSLIKPTYILLGLLPLTLILFYINYHYYGNIFRSGYYFAKETSNFSLDLVPEMFIKYMFALNLIYPFMVVLSFLSRIKDKLALLGSVFSILVFYLVVPNYSFEGKITDLILAIRLIIPVVPLLILLYSKVISEQINRKLFKEFLLVVLATLVFNVFLLSLIHQIYLNNSVVNF